VKNNSLLQSLSPLPSPRTVLRTLCCLPILALAAIPALEAQSCPPTSPICATAVNGSQGSLVLNDANALAILQPQTGSTAKSIVFRLGGNDAATSLSIQNSSFIDMFHLTGDAKVGFGTLNPAYKFQVVGGDDTQFAITRTGQLGLVGIATSQLNNSSISFDASYLASQWTAPATSHTASFLYKLNDHFQLRTWYDTAQGPIAAAPLTTAIDVDLKTGAVGIGANKVASQGVLDVGGTIHADGDVTADGAIFASYSQDLAEWVPSDVELAAGTVVVLDKRQKNHVLASRISYDTSVAGVVSGKPAIVLGQRRADMAAIATTGRVPVRVDATRHPIAVGDLLVTGESSGVAMRSEPMALNGRAFHQPGTILGKALEPLAGGTGTILVLLSLQ
jgi:hypothetical protein